ncbi:MAG: TMEM175 family protein, partial [Nocardioidaceae bacterium]
ALGADLKGKLSPFAYVAGIGLSLVLAWLGVVVYTVVAIAWLIPDRRMERLVRADQVESH